MKQATTQQSSINIKKSYKSLFSNFNAVRQDFTGPYKAKSTNSINQNLSNDGEPYERSVESICITPSCYNHTKHPLIHVNIDVEHIGYICKSGEIYYDKFSDGRIRINFSPSISSNDMGRLLGYPSTTCYCIGNLCYANQTGSIEKSLSGWGEFK